MLFDYAREAMYLVEEGAYRRSGSTRSIRDFGFPMGPFQMFDLSGLDVFWQIAQERPKTPSDARVEDRRPNCYEMKRYGQKTGGGIYEYVDR